MPDRENRLLKSMAFMVPLLVVAILSPHAGGRRVRRAVINMESSCYNAFETMDTLERCVVEDILPDSLQLLEGRGRD